MDKEEIEELKDFTIDINDIDELALGLEVCSKKSNMVIQEFANLIIELQQENQKLKENYDRIYNENCILREKHNINDIILLDENYKLKQVIDKAIEYIEIHKRKDEFLELNEWGTRDLLEILKGE